MRTLRLTGLIALGLLLAVGVIALAGYLLVRTKFAAGRLAAMAEGVTGQPVSVESLEVGYFPRPRLVIAGLRLNPPEGFGAEPLPPGVNSMNCASGVTCKCSNLTSRDCLYPAPWRRLGNERCGHAELVGRCV